MDAKFGPFAALAAGTRIGGVSKTLTIAYWRALGLGYTNAADKLGIILLDQGAANERDQLGQLSIAEDLIGQGFVALLLSSQTDANLIPAVEKVKAANIPVLNVNDAVIPSAKHYVGNAQKGNGVNVATTILQQYPDLIGFYANHDGMALGVVEAVKAAGKQSQVAVFGTDGISDAYAAIKAGDLTGTVESFPVLTGEIAIEVSHRLLAGQKLQRVVATPQARITKDHVDTYSTTDMAALRAALLK